MTAVAAGSFVVGVLIGVAVGDLTRRHLRRVNRMLADDVHRARALRDQWMQIAQDRLAAPDARDWVRRSEVIRLAHVTPLRSMSAEQAEVVAAENRELRRQLAHREAPDA